MSQRVVQPFGISGPHWKKSCLGPHIKYIVTRNHKKKSHNVLSRFTILCWTPFTAIPNLMQPMGCRLVSPGTASSLYWRIASTGVWQEPLTQSKLHQPIGNDSYINSKICSLCLNGGTTLQGNVIPSSLETRLTETGSVHLNYCPSFCF